ncbi:hypothetical protein RAMDARK_1479 [Rickettsia amblyommatis str. Darkwater]|uniref:Uncharacterized protein n=1 Tax=Rickettsia amblyommatis str. Ac/Pa TaxID=1359164 RepID=A0A0F3N2B3_RICAM|nr:hypothetical protein APHACPA_0033 [Rickettsia amblyommatis str. Ac/Pa]KJV88927.1 hypothetical protein RAMDARK_1479 [Rickettsia amblyommatis str. Darkwater]
MIPSTSALAEFEFDSFIIYSFISLHFVKQIILPTKLYDTPLIRTLQ